MSKPPRLRSLHGNLDHPPIKRNTSHLMVTQTEGPVSVAYGSPQDPKTLKKLAEKKNAKVFTKTVAICQINAVNAGI